MLDNNNIYIYKQFGERVVDVKDDDIYSPAFLPGSGDDAAICIALSKEEAIKKFKKYYENVTDLNVFSLEELYWIPNDDVSILTSY